MKRKKVINESSCQFPFHSFECWFNFFSWRILLAGFGFGVVAQVIHSSGAFMTMGYYTDPSYFGLWSKLMMPYPQAFSSSFIYYSLMVNFFLGLIFAGIYKWVRSSFCGQSLGRGLCFGWLLFLTKSFPFFLTSFLLLNLPFGLLIFWLVEDFVIDLAGGLILAMIIKGR